MQIPAKTAAFVASSWNRLAAENPTLRARFPAGMAPADAQRLEPAETRLLLQLYVDRVTRTPAKERDWPLADVQAALDAFEAAR